MKRAYLYLSILTSLLLYSCEKEEAEELLIDSGDIRCQLSSVFFINNTGWIVGDNDSIYKTRDGGTKWSVSASGTNENLASVYFSDENTGYCAGDKGTILRSINGGKTWTKCETQIATNLNAVRFINSQVGFIVGDYGVILKTEDGGINWRLVPSGTLHSLRSIAFGDENTGYIVGWAGAILKTINSGNDWKLLDVTTTWLESVSFVNSNLGFAVGGDRQQNGTLLFYPGSILKTVDGGVTWSSLTNLSSYSLLSVFFSSIDIGYAVGYHGVILKTLDGGLSWTRINSGIEQDLYSVFDADSKIYMVGSNGTILKLSE